MRKLFTLLLCISFLLISLVGCQNAAKKPTTPARKPGVTAKKTSSEMTASERRVMASRLSKMAENVKGVRRASVVVSSIGMSNAGMGTTKSTNKSTTTNNLNSTNPNSRMNTNPNNNLNNKMNNTNTAKTNYSGQMVMVGLTLEPTATRDPATQNKIKSTVANKLKASDRRISQVLVTTDPTLIKRINDVAAGIIEGKPIQNFQSDINDITRKVKQQRPAF
ncbi:YhcN/YlaJ family sporulation lipoprotein [Syntrophomonas curvata]